MVSVSVTGISQALQRSCGWVTWLQFTPADGMKLACVSEGECTHKRELQGVHLSHMCILQTKLALGSGPNTAPLFNRIVVSTAPGKHQRYNKGSQGLSGKRSLICIWTHSAKVLYTAPGQEVLSLSEFLVCKTILMWTTLKVYCC